MLLNNEILAAEHIADLLAEAERMRLAEMAHAASVRRGGRRRAVAELAGRVAGSVGAAFAGLPLPAHRG